MRPSVGDPNPTTEVACNHRGCQLHGGGVGASDWRLHCQIDRDLELEIPVDSGTRATNRRPRLYPQGFRHPP
ncbi:hypothetical protein CRG98_020440 [Punica granatum]|uniref:Uncharacterized protein n=1 Tax=Punica granatum TaxID=22663 RepID=A0A2I0JS93_PUNGR|nr:hypothetical protein CRG98_020440 [Punica granatum]